MTKQLEGVTDPAERWKQTKDVLRELHRLRREDHHAQQIRLAREKWDQQVYEAEEEEERETEEARKKKLLAKYKAHRDLPLRAQLAGGGQFGAKWAHLENVRDARSADAVRGGTRRIRSLRHRRSRGKSKVRKPQCSKSRTMNRSGLVKVSQAQSRPVKVN